MKRLWIVCLVVLLLAGCTAQNGQTQPPETTIPQETTVPTEPLPSFYVENSPMERGTGGAVRLYEMEDTVTGVTMLEGNLLLCTDNRTLYLLSPDTMEVLRTRTLETDLQWDDESFVITRTGIAYYDEAQNVYASLDANLGTASSFTLDEDMVSRPVINAAMDRVYYATESGISVLYPADGTSRRLREEHGSIVSVDGLLFEDTLLCYTRQTENGEVQKCFIDVEDGSLQDAEVFGGQIFTWDNSYSCVMELHHAMGDVSWLVTGSRDGAMQRLNLRHGWDRALLLENGIAVLQSASQVGVTLYCYDLTTGKLISSVIMPEQYETFPWGCTDGSRIWLADGSGIRIYCWDTAVGGSADSGSELADCLMLGDEAADFSTCKSNAQRIGERFGVTVQYMEGDNSTPGVDYSNVPDLRTEQYDLALAELEKAMQMLPGDFLKKAGQTAASRRMTVCLVDDYDPAAGTAPATGSIDVSGGEVVIYVSMCPELKEVFYHELFHVLDIQILNESDGMNHWEELNPEGFEYVNTYSIYYSGGLKNSEHLMWGSNAFADEYSMISPREDRAQVFVYAIMQDQAFRFGSPVMQEKLTLICKMLRECFDLPQGETPVWEQYIRSDS